MKKSIWSFGFALLLATQSFAQDTMSPAIKIYRIAVFSPLHLDSAFSADIAANDRSIPKFIIPALDFTKGARIALDTLPLNGKRAEAYIYDSKSSTQPISWLIRYKKLDSIDLIIGSVR